MAEAPIESSQPLESGETEDSILISVEQGLSPVSFDIVVGSYDEVYSGSGPLHNYIANELGIAKTQHSVIVKGSGFRILEFLTSNRKTPIIFCQVVSIQYRSKSNVDFLSRNFSGMLTALFKQMNKPTLSGLNRNLRIWIPTLGTGSGKLSHYQSVNLVNDGLSRALKNKNFRKQISQIVICPPPNLGRENIEDIEDVIKHGVLEEFGYRAPIDDHPPESINTIETSEMPDQFHSDHALKDISDDDLGRVAIAETIATNVARVWEDQKKVKRPFAIHLSGRWGSGKSSILTFLDTILSKDKTCHDEGWVVIDYNAWHMQDAGPAWWSLLNTVREQGYKYLGDDGKKLNRKDLIWQKFTLVKPWAIMFAVLIFAVLCYVVVNLITAFLPVNDGNIVPKDVDGNTEPKDILTFLSVFIGGLSSIGVLLKLVQGWSKTRTETAEYFRGIQADPTAILKERYDKVIKNIERPIVVLIDDLDRCDSPFVVELLQSLQTSYSQAPVLYVIASDRDWIVSAYNQAYKDFKPEISKPGEPIGYLFVKKIFQLSVPVPDIGSRDRKRLTEKLLGTKTDTQTETASKEERVIELKEAAALGDLSRISQIQSEALDQGQNLAREVMQAITAPENQRRIKHKLLDYTDLFDGNPRSIKRLINTLTFRQGNILTAAEHIPFDVITRWSILSLRYPYTADILSANPNTEIPDTANADFPNPQIIRSILGELSIEDIERAASFG